jgi:hypothetical protein
MGFNFRKRGPQNLFGAWPTMIAIAQLPVLIIALILLPPPSDWIVVVFVSNAALGLLCLAWIRRRLQIQLRAANGRLCVDCRYSLKDLPSPGICPKCGEGFPLDGYASPWKPIRENETDRTV